MKLHFVCPPYPNEWAYSLAARTMNVVGLTSASPVVRLLFGIRRLSLGLGLVSNRSGFSSSFEPLTLLRWISAFVLHPLKKALLRENVEAADYTRVGFDLGGTGSRRLCGQFLRYCPKCAAQQRKKYGEAYWCVLAQAVGVDYCWTHKIRYLDSNVSRRKPGGLTRLEDALLPNPSYEPARSAQEKAILSLSCAANLLLDFQPVWDSARLNRSWRSVLKELGLKKGTRGAAKHLANGLRDRYGNDYLERVGCRVGVSVELSWVARFLRNPAKESDPLRHLLILGWAGKTLKELAEGATIHLADPRVFNSSLICRNPVCPSIEKPWSGQTRIFIDRYTRQETAHLTCRSCSQTIGRLLEEHGKEVPDWIVDRGELWRKSLHEMWGDAALSLRQIGHKLAAEPLTIKRHAFKARLPFPRTSKRLTRVLPKGMRVTKAEDPKVRETRRNLWLAAVAKASGASNARKLEPAAYAWLRRNDLGWLGDHTPARTALSNQGATRVNWGARELQFLRMLPGAFYRITTRRPFQQITATAMLREIGGEQSLPHLDRMPKLKAELLLQIEDSNLYVLRRLASTIQEMGGPFTMNQLCRKAGVQGAVAHIPAVCDWVAERAGNYLQS